MSRFRIGDNVKIKKKHRDENEYLVNDTKDTFSIVGVDNFGCWVVSLNKLPNWMEDVESEVYTTSIHRAYIYTNELKRIKDEKH